MSSDNALVSILEKAIDTKIEKTATRGKTQTVSADFIGTDEQGISWVRLEGSSGRTPIRNSYVEVSAGDKVAVTVGNGYAVISSNISNPSAGVHKIQNITKNITRIENNLQYNYAHVTDGIIDNAYIDHAKVQDLDANYAHITEGTIDNAEIDHAKVKNLEANYAHISDGIIDNAKIGYADVQDLNAHYAHIEKGVIDNAKIGHADVLDLQANYAHIVNGVIDNAKIDDADVNNLEAHYAHITNGEIDNAQISHAKVKDLNANYAHITNGDIDNANINHARVNGLNANYAHIANGVIDNATIDQADVNNLSANYAHIANGVIDNAKIDQADVNNLSANYAHITNGSIDNAKIHYGNVDQLNSHYAQIDLANIANGTIKTAMIDDAQITAAKIKNGEITTAKIGDAQITSAKIGSAAIKTANIEQGAITNALIANEAVGDAQIIGVSANKLTAGTIDANKITVTNLNAKNIKVEKINGQTVTGKSIADALATHESDISDLDDKIDDAVEELNSRIDAQIQTYTVTGVPTLNNYPANEWATAALKQEHVGDICYLVNAASEYDGFTYRFAYDNTTSSYGWVLIKDNQVTAALQRLSDVEGDVASLQSFESETSSWIDETDQGITTIRQNHTSLVAVVDKTVKASVQLWFTKANTTAPAAPTSHITTNDPASANTWNLAVPTYSSTYPNYFYCWEYQYTDNTYGWSAVVRDIAMGETQSTARSAQSTANTANTNASNAVSTANSANTTASNAANTANNANVNAANALSTANTAASDASSAVSTANTANTNASNAVSTANTANTNASNAVSTANTAKATADKNIKSSVLLWFSKANATAPDKPTSKVTSTDTGGNAWRVVVPTYNSSYPYYFYCYQYVAADGTVTWSDVVYDRATTETQSTARAASSSLTSYITSNNQAVASLQSQIDGAVDIWYGSSDPAASTKPWPSGDADSIHEGDLYYNTMNGHSFRYVKSGNTYSWSQIPDSDAAAALAAANTAQATADGKRRIFTAQPAPPYDIGDLWVNGKVVKYASVKRESGSYVAADWALTATDDTAANAAQSTANSAATAAATADGKAVTAQGTANANIKSSIMLWFSKANSTTPGKPTSQVTSTSTGGNAWTTVVPVWNATYPHYFYCYQQQKGDGTWLWTDVVYDRATSEAQQKAAAALPASTFTTFQSTTFKELVDEVDEQSSTITNMTETINSMNPIVSAEGERTFTTYDAAELPLLTLDALGESMQDGTPAPNAPIAIRSVRPSNYLLGTQFSDESKLDSWTKNQNPILSFEDGCFKIINNQTSSTPGAWHPIALTQGTYRVSFDWKAINSDQTTISAMGLWHNGTKVANFPSSGGSGSSQNYWHHVKSGTVTLTAEQAKNVNRFYIFMEASIATSGVYIKNLCVYRDGAPDIYTDENSIGIVCSNGNITYIDLQSNELHGLDSTYRDTLTVDASGHVIVEKRVGKMVLDGSVVPSQIFTFSGYLAAFWYSYAQWIGDLGGYPLKYQIASSGPPSAKYFKCDTLPNGDGNYRNNSNASIDRWNDSSATFIISGDSSITSAATAAAWLQAHPTTIIYPIDESAWYTIDLGYIDLPEVSDGSIVYVAAEVQPVIGGSWWTRYGQATGGAFEVNTNTVNSVRQTADSNQAHISNITTRIGLNPDGTGTTTDIVSKYSQLDQDLDGLTSRVGKVESQTSLRGIIKRDNWAETDWNNYPVGSTPAWTNLNYSATAATSSTGIDGTTLRIGDLIQITGKSTDKQIPHNLICKVTSVPSSASADIPTVVIAVDDMSGVNTRLSSAETTISQHTDAISLRATKTELTNAINGIEIGGTNLLQGSSLLTAGSESNRDGLAVADGGYGGSKKHIETNTAWRGPYIKLGSALTRAGIKIGEKVTLSIMLSTDSSTEVSTPVIYLYRANASANTPGINGSSGVYTVVNLVSGKWVRLWCTFEVTEYALSADMTRFELSQSTSYKCMWSAPKLEKGTKATDWTPAPEDMASQAELKVQADRIGMVVSNADASSSLELTSDAMTYIGGHVEITDPNGTTTLIEGGKLKTNLLSVSSMSDAGSTVKYTRTEYYLSTSQTTLSGGSWQSTKPTLTTGSYLWQRTAIWYATFSGTNYTTSNAQAYQPDSTGVCTTVTPDIQVGGRNLLASSRLQESTWGITPLSSKDTGNVQWWAYTIVSTSNLRAIIEPNTQYTFSYDYELVFAQSGKTDFDIHAGFLFYSASSPDASRHLYVYTRIEPASGHKSWTFTTPSTLPTDYRILGYTNRYTDGTSDQFRFTNIKLEKGNRETDWTPPPEDIEANAIAETQRIYYRSKVSGTVTSPGTTWITKTTDQYNDTVTVGVNGWTTKITPLANGVGGTKYIYLYTATQKKMADGTVTTGPILLDDSTTIIDGGSIVTGSVAANKISVTDLQAFGATIGGFAIDTTSIHTKDVAVTSNADNSIALSSADFTRTILSTSRSGLRFAIGDKLGVTGDGVLYANGANITNINASNISSGTISADRIAAGAITIGKLADDAKYGTVYTYFSEGNTSQYVKLCTIAPTASNVNRDVMFSLSSRGYAHNTRVKWCFTNTSAPSAAKVHHAIKTGSVQMWYVAEGSGVYGIYTKKAESWELIDVHDFYNPHPAGITVTWLGTNVESLPSGAVAFTDMAGDMTQSEVLEQGTTATNYISMDSTNGLKIAQSNPAAATSNYLQLNSNGAYMYKDSTHFTHQASDGFHVYSGDASNDIAHLGTSLRIGKTHGPHTLIQDSGVDYYGAFDGSVNLVHFGYASGNAESGTATAPYYSIGLRNPGVPPGNFSMVEGYGSSASGFAAHAEGYGQWASGNYSHAEGYTGQATGIAAHSEGYGCYANGNYSHAQGLECRAKSEAQTVFGKYNVEDTYNAFALIIGNGSSTTRSNALTLAWNGELTLATALPIASGGTGSTTASAAWTALGGGSIGKKNSLAASDIPNLPASKINSGTLAIVNGGTGSTAVTTATSGIFTAGENINIASQRISVWGKVAMVFINIKPTANITLTSPAPVILTAAEGYRPPLAMQVFLLCAQEGHDAYMDGTGKVYPRANLLQGGSYWYQATYLLA